MHEVFVVAPVRQACLEYAGRIVHRTSLQTGERQHHGMVSHVSAECLILRSACTLIAHKVRPGAADAGRTCCLVSIHHDVVLGGSLDDALIVVVHQLTVMVFASRNDVAHISCLHGVIAIPVHQTESVLHVSLVI